MPDVPRFRAAVLVGLLLVAFLVLPVWFGSLPPAPGSGDYPGERELLDDYGGYVGDRVTVSGQVVDSDPVTIHVGDGTGRTTVLTVTDLGVNADEGEELRVFGVVQPDGEIRAVSAFTVPPWGRLYAVFISFLAGLWVLARLLRHWRLDIEALALRRRTGPPGVPQTGSRGRERPAGGGEDDA